MVWLKWACRSILKSGLGVMIISSKDNVLCPCEERPLLRTRVDVCHKRGEVVRRQKVLYMSEGQLLASENRMTRDLLLLTLRREWYDRG